MLVEASDISIPNSYPVGVEVLKRVSTPGLGGLDVFERLDLREIDDVPDHAFDDIVKRALSVARMRVKTTRLDQENGQWIGEPFPVIISHGFFPADPDIQDSPRVYYQVESRLFSL